MSKLIMMRHGQSQWNLMNLFTGWVDIPLTEKGIDEAIEGGKKIKNFKIDKIFMSSLMRAQMTAMLAMSVHNSKKVPVIMHPQDSELARQSVIHNEEALRNCIPTIIASELNERMYGDLQGLNKQETIDKYGKEQVHIWRRSYDVAPPNGESLKMTAARSIPYFEKYIIPELEQGKNVFISAHGNSLRSIVMDIEKLSTDEVLKLEIATGEPLVYNYENSTFTKEFLGAA